MYWLYQDSRPSSPKGNSKLKILLIFLLSLKQKTNQILQAAIERIKFFLFRKAIYGWLKQGITTGQIKTKAIQADFAIFRHIQAYADIFRHNQACSGIIQAYSE